MCKYETCVTCHTKETRESSRHKFPMGHGTRPNFLILRIYIYICVVAVAPYYFIIYCIQFEYSILYVEHTICRKQLEVPNRNVVTDTRTFHIIIITHHHHQHEAAVCGVGGSGTVPNNSSTTTTFNNNSCCTTKSRCISESYNDCDSS